MKIIVLLCFILGVFCFAAKDTLDARTTYLNKSKHLAVSSESHQTKGVQATYSL